MRFSRISGSLLAAAAAVALSFVQAGASTLPVTRATLANGLQVIVVHDPLAPVVTTMLNYRAGGDEQAYPGLAHALEHMMFRGSSGISESQLSDISAVLGGNSDADTQNTVTQYFFTVPSQYLDVALRLEAARAKDLNLDQKDWNIERGAIENEVTQDNSQASYRGFRKIETGLLAGTPYANDVLGTMNGFKHEINAPQLRAFYKQWYHPNNAVYVIAGNVDGPSTIAAVRRYFGGIPAAKLPARKPVVFAPVKPAVYHEDSDQPYGLVIVGYRFPGYQDKDYAAAQILESVLNNERSDLYGLVVSGKALFAGMQSQNFPKASVEMAISAVPVSTKPEQADADLRGVLAQYKKTGIPAPLVAVAKARAIANAEFKGNSIEGLAGEWSQAVAVEGHRDPDQFLNALRAVSVADVNRVLRTYVSDSHAIAAYMVPKNGGKTASGGGMAKESNKLDLTHHDPLPAWAVALLKSVKVPEQTIHPSDMRLSNGLRLIVVPEKITRTVIVHGQVDSNPKVQTPTGKDGVADVASQLLSYGTTTYDRVAFLSELDKIAADTQAGTDFSLKVLSDKFDRGLQLLADEELHPAFPAQNFATVKQQTVAALQGEMTSPAHLAEVALNKALYPPGDSEQRYATPETAATITLDDVKAYYHGVYRPDMTTIVVIGDTTPAAARALVEKYFGAWSATGPKPVVDPPAVPNSGPADVVVPATGRVQSSVKLAETLKLTRLDPDWATLRLASTILGGGGSSILFHDLRDRHGYVYSVYTALNADRTRSTFEVNFASDPAKVLPAQSAAVRDITAMQQLPTPANELQFGKAELISSVPLQQASYDGVTALLLRYAGVGLPLDQNLIDARRQLAVTQATLRATVSKWIRPKDFARVIEGPGPK